MNAFGGIGIMERLLTRPIKKDSMADSVASSVSSPATVPTLGARLALDRTTSLVPQVAQAVQRQRRAVGASLAQQPLYVTGEHVHLQIDAIAGSTPREIGVR